MVAVMMALSPRLRQQSRSSPWVWESSGRTAIESSSRESPTGERCCVFRVFVRELVPFECAESRTYDDARVVYLGIALAYIYQGIALSHGSNICGRVFFCIAFQCPVPGKLLLSR